MIWQVEARSKDTNLIETWTVVARTKGDAEKVVDRQVGLEGYTNIGTFESLGLLIQTV